MAEVNLYVEVGKIALTAIAAGFGAYFSIRIFPLKAKQDEWYWQKNVESEVFLLESLSQIMFLTNDHIGSEYDYQSSMVKDNEIPVDNRVRTLVMEVHSRSALLMPYLKKAQCTTLESFLKKTQACYDEAKRTWGDWDSNDHGEEAEAHMASTFSDLYIIAEESLELFKFEYVNQKK